MYIYVYFCILRVTVPQVFSCFSALLFLVFLLSSVICFLCVLVFLFSMCVQCCFSVFFCFCFFLICLLFLVVSCLFRFLFPSLCCFTKGNHVPRSSSPGRWIPSPGGGAKLANSVNLLK